MPVTELNSHRTGMRIHGLRWWIVTLVFLATLVCYIDRLTVSVLAPVICSALHLSNLDYAGVNTWFLLAYAGGMVFLGKLLDWMGTRRGYAGAMLIWSLAESAHAFATGIFSLSAFRFGLGMGESGQWPAATKTAAEWFPIEERALGMGIINAGASLGPAVAAPLVVALELHFGWKATFIVTGSLGLFWILVWLFFHRLPEHHPWIAAEERDYILSGQKPAERTAAPSWRELLRHREVWGITLARFFGDPLWWLYLIWLPLYLTRARGFSLKEIGLFVWIPYLAAAAGSLSGGWASGWLVSRGWKVYGARGGAILLATLLAPAGLLVGSAPSAVSAMAFISLVLFSFQFWVNNVQTLPSDLFPTGFVGSIAGLAGTAAGIGAAAFTVATGWVVDHFSYRPILLVSGLLLPLGTGILYLLIRPSRFRDAAAARSGSPGYGFSR